MVKKDLGVLKSVSLRDVFSKEDKEFTPWLNENISNLNEVLGIEIIDTQTEVPVGSFKLDILGTIAGTDKKVIIENQIEPTDHNHLGQILTYASGISASTIIWVAKEFREEHISALEWLNNNITNSISFFGIEVKARQIDNSKPALEFEVVVKPNEWERTLGSVEAISDTQKNYLNFFEKLAEEYVKFVPTWKKRKAQPQSWLASAAGKTGFGFTWAFGAKKFKVELYIDTGDLVTNKSYFDELLKFKDEIEQELKEQASFEKLEERRACRIAIYKDISGNINSISENEKKEIIKWGIEKMKIFSDALSKYVQRLN